MNQICLNCPRYNPEKAKQEGKPWFCAHYCAGEENPRFTGCVRKPFNPLADTLKQAFIPDIEQWVDKTWNPETKTWTIQEMEV